MNQSSSLNSARDSSTDRRPVAAIILAAGESKRMKSDLVKVLHPVCGRPMIDWVIDSCRAAGCDRLILVVGHQGDQVRARFDEYDDIQSVTQHERLGTGHAVQQAEPALRGFDGDIVVLAGDGPLIRPGTLRALIDLHQRSCAAATIATAVLDNPSGYGRILRDADSGRFMGIVEERDAAPSQRSIREVNPSYYCFRSAELFRALRLINTQNASGELYLTDTLGVLIDDGRQVELLPAVAPDEAKSINTVEQLREVERLLEARLEREATP